MTIRLMTMFSVLVLLSGPAFAFELGLPIACTVGDNCFIQQYVDRDRGPGTEDYACGSQTYDGHKGIDIRLRSIADVQNRVAVLAAAPGVVVALRDRMPDRLVRTEEERKAIAEHECGNGVRIDHGQGWQTQYCHLRQGSVLVKQGQHVAVGRKLGEVGYSGDAAFPHMHLQVTKDGRVVDPFLPDPTTPCESRGTPLWSALARAALVYQPGALLALGFVDRAITLEELEAGEPAAAPNRHTPVVAYMWAINLEKGDVVDIELRYGSKVIAKNSRKLERNKAQFMLFAGKKAPPGGWLKGTYTSAARILRDGKPEIKDVHSTKLH